VTPGALLPPLATALRTAHAEWVQTAQLVIEDGWARPLTAHSYEGLLTLVGGENWKSLDAVAVRLQGPLGADPVWLEDVAATPLEFTHFLGTAYGTWRLEYQLAPLEAGSLWLLSLTAPDSLPGPRSVEIRPVFDLRHMYGESNPESLTLRRLPGGRVAVEGAITAVWQTPEGAEFVSERRLVDLSHPMGSGFREEAGERIHFTAETTRGVEFGWWAVPIDPGQTVTVRLSVARSTDEALGLLDSPGVQAALDERARHWEACIRLVGDRPGLAERCFVMAHGFGMDVAGTRLPEAGGWWFRTPWFRDVFEGLLSNWRTLKALGLEDRVKGALVAAARLQDPLSGRIPNRLPEHRADTEAFERDGRLPDEYYHATDATTLFFLLLSESGICDPELSRLAEQVYRRAIAAFQSADPEAIDGPAVLDASTGLLWSVPWHTWTDGKRTLAHAEGLLTDLPLRMPRAWQEEALASGRDPEEVWRENHRPVVLLPEINAQWLRMLDWGTRNLPEGDPEREWSVRTLARARAAYRDTFWDGIRLANLVHRDGRIDWTPGSPAVVSLAVTLPLDLFTRSERREAWQYLAAALLVHHRGRPFGLLVKDSDERVYLGDAQYHEAVVWPRDTAYGLRLLQDLGDAETVRALRESNLEHQQREGVLFYSHELFSLMPPGNGPHRLEAGHHLVPVKNPMQWWSQWCDPFFLDPPGPSGTER